MRLDYLSIKSFKNLRDFEIDIDETNPLPHVIILGANGAGKSNLIEALLAIFNSLYMESKPPFAYTLRYKCSGHNIAIEVANEASTPVFTVNGNNVPRSEFLRGVKSGECLYLPRFVFGYYSGASDRFRDYFVEPQRRFYQQLKKPDADPERLPFRPIFLAQHAHGQFVLLSFYSKPDDRVRRFLHDHLGILDLDSVLFVIKRPQWQKKKSSDRFWGAAGIPRSFLDRLYSHALAPLKHSRPAEVDYRARPKRIECWNLFLDRTRFDQLASAYARPQDFFKVLESTDISDLLLEIRVTVKVRTIDGAISFRELSEGEQQLLLVLGLLRFTAEDESLFLLDEPDTHLNPAWSVQYLAFIEEIVGKQASGHIVMATHDPLVFAGLTRREVRVMQRDDITGRIKAAPPAEDPRGMGVEAILTSDLFRLKSALDLPTQKALDRKRELQSIANKSVDEDRELQQLTDSLADERFSTGIGDPLYPLFVAAMTAAQKSDYLDSPTATLTPEQISLRERRAAEIVRRLREESASRRAGENQ